ncbi:MAG: dihydroxyacetone kinase subunit L [Planctomycetes bacterium SCN 63-9]|nr:MAG: dihydroxyacetone kinase subunit L [Planctomycetes bacterium SCN 63-9]
MKKLINEPNSVVEQMLQGLVAIHPGLKRLAGESVLIRADAEAAKERQVGLIAGGGSGHEPAHAGYVGRGMLGAAVAGDVFTSPGPDAVHAAIRAVAGPRGALLIVKNYTGDRINFGLAAEHARAEGIPVEIATVADDVALSGGEGHAGRRGLAGTILVHKIAGALAESGASLAEVAGEARAVAAAVRTMGVALTPCTVPAAGKPGFSLGEGEVELGLGIHGEPGVRRIPIEPADALVDQLMGPILVEVPGDRLVLMVNNLGGTPVMELAIVARRAIERLEQAGKRVERVYAGTFLSALEMAGVSLTVLPVDDRRLDLLDASTDAPAWPNAADRPRSKSMEEAAPETEATRTQSAVGEPCSPLGKRLGAAIRAVSQSLIDAEPRLTELDQAAGDGDLGISLSRGAKAILDAFPSYPLEDPASTLHELALTLQRSLGGTSGPLYAMALFRAAASLRANDPKQAISWVQAFQAGAAGIAEIGGASVGDRTMLDALIPASEAMAAALQAGNTPLSALGEGVAEADRAANATAELTPRRGRSSYLGDRALGHPDPGAVAVAIWLKAVDESLSSTE